MAILTNLQILPHCLLCKDFKQCKRKFTPNVHGEIYKKYKIGDECIDLSYPLKCKKPLKNAL